MYLRDFFLHLSRFERILLQSMKEIAPPPAAPKLNMKVSLHSATQCMVVVIDTLRGILSMSRVMAMAMKSELVAQFLPSSFTLGRDVIYFYQVSRSKVQFTPPAFSLLLLKELCERSFKHRMISESLAPIEEISIVGASFSVYLGVSLDVRLIMLPDFLLFWG